MMNRHGETFEDRPPAGEYWLCPLHGCKYKLLVGDVEAVPPESILLQAEVGTWTLGDPMQAWKFGADPYRRDLSECDRLMREHLKTHKMFDFYATMAGYHQEYREKYREKVAKIERLADLVFHATATQEQAEEGGHRWA